MALWLIRPCIGHSDPSLLPNVGWLGSGPFLVGRIGSGVLIIASLQKRIPAGLCRMWQQKAGHDLGGVLSGGLTPVPRPTISVTLCHSNTSHSQLPVSWWTRRRLRQIGWHSSCRNEIRWHICPAHVLPVAGVTAMIGWQRIQWCNCINCTTVAICTIAHFITEIRHKRCKICSAIFVRFSVNVTICTFKIFDSLNDWLMYTVGAKKNAPFYFLQ